MCERLNPFEGWTVYLGREQHDTPECGTTVANKDLKKSEPPKNMKKTLKKSARANYSLGDLIMAVSSYTKNNRETVAAVADLLESGRVRLSSHGRKIRARVY